MPCNTLQHSVATFVFFLHLASSDSSARACRVDADLRFTRRRWPSCASPACRRRPRVVTGALSRHKFVIASAASSCTLPNTPRYHLQTHDTLSERLGTDASLAAGETDLLANHPIMANPNYDASVAVRPNLRSSSEPANPSPRPTLAERRRSSIALLTLPVARLSTWQLLSSCLLSHALVRAHRTTHGASHEHR